MYPKMVYLYLKLEFRGLKKSFELRLNSLFKEAENLSVSVYYCTKIE